MCPKGGLYLQGEGTGEAYFMRIRKPHGEGTGIPLQYSCLEHPMDGGAW